MICNKCNSPVSDEMYYCENCGEPVNREYNQQPFNSNAQNTQSAQADTQTGYAQPQAQPDYTQPGQSNYQQAYQQPNT